MMGTSQSAVSRAWIRFQQTGSATRQAGSGRTRCTTAAQDRFLVHGARQDPMLPATTHNRIFRQATGIIISSETVRRRLKVAGLRSRRPAVSKPLTVRHRAERLAFAQEHVNWTIDQWRPVLFTDESRFGSIFLTAGCVCGVGKGNAIWRTTFFNTTNTEVGR